MRKGTEGILGNEDLLLQLRDRGLLLPSELRAGTSSSLVAPSPWEGAGEDLDMQFEELEKSTGKNAPLPAPCLPN